MMMSRSLLFSAFVAVSADLQHDAGLQRKQSLIPPGECTPDIIQDAGFTGTVIDNHTDSLLLDESYDYMALRCCSVAEALAPFMRSKNVTDALNFTIREVGPSHQGKKHDFECVIYDDGAMPISSPGFWAGNTRNGLDPQPPAPAPPPSCDSFTTQNDCDDTRRCFWTEESCGAPPIDCGSNYGDNLPMCTHVHVSLDSDGRYQEWQLLDFSPDNGTHVVVPPPQKFTTDLWFSVESREYITPTPHLEFWQECVTYQSANTQDASDIQEFKVCMALDGVYHGSIVMTDGLAKQGEWWVNEPYVFSSTLGFNISQEHVFV